MPIIQAWECPQTGKLFKDKSKYLVHLRRKARENLDERKRMKWQAEKVAFFKNMRDTCENAAEIANFIKENWTWFVSNGRDRDTFSRKPAPIPELQNINLGFQYSDRVSTSHHAPFGKRANFCNPQYFPGWRGRLQFTYAPDAMNCFRSSIFEGTGICCGSGSGNGRVYSCDVYMFADDWPLMAQKEVLRILQK